MNAAVSPWRVVRYISVFSLPILAVVAFTQRGMWSFAPMIEAFVLIPLLELFLPKDVSNFSEGEEQQLLADRWYDVLLYLVVPVQYACLGLFLYTVTHASMEPYEWAGVISSMGLLCGALAINVAHELGHRHNPGERFLAKMLLLTSLYNHFYIEHNRGHHVNVSTREDPSSARYGEILYFFWVRSVVGAYFSAWRLEAKRLRIAKKPVFSLHNEMIVYTLLHAALVGGIYVLLGTWPMVCFLIAATMGFLLLETVNYIEHYGLQRVRSQNDRYERVKPIHSWNSDHRLGRWMLFELSRHSDHHYKADRKYPVLRHHEHSPQMPTGYPGMMVLALVPPLFFAVVHPRIKDLHDSGEAPAAPIAQASPT